MKYIASTFKLFLILLLAGLHFYIINQWINAFSIQPAKRSVVTAPPIMINFIVADLPTPAPATTSIDQQHNPKIEKTTQMKSVVKQEVKPKKAAIMPAKTEKVAQLQLPKSKKLAAPQKTQTAQLPAKSGTKTPAKPQIKPVTQSPTPKQAAEAKSIRPTPIATQTIAIDSTAAPTSQHIESTTSSSASGNSNLRGAASQKSSFTSSSAVKSNSQVQATAKKSHSYTPPSHHAAYLHNPKPVYPRISQQLEEQGTVQLLVNVNIHGQVSQAQIKRSSGYPRLDTAALQAVQQWKFIPAKQGDTPIIASTIVPIVFQLSEE